MSYRVATHRLVAAAALLSATTIAQDATFAAQSAEQWAEALLTDRATAVARLTTGGQTALPLLRALLDDPRRDVRRGVARVCVALGPAARPLGERLTPLLYEVDDTTVDELARALVAIDDRRPEVQKALLAVVLDSWSFERPTACGRALLTFDELATQHVLQAIDRAAAERVARPGQAAQSLGALDDRAIPSLIAALDRSAPFQQTARDAARDSLVRRSWRAAAQLERAGHRELAAAALSAGGPREVQGMADYTLEADPTQRPRLLDRLPLARWESAEEQHSDLVLCRGTDRGRGFAVARLRLLLDPAGERSPEVVADMAVQPRTLAFAAMRQVMSIPTLHPREKPRANSWQALLQSHVAVQLTIDDERLLDEAFTAARSSRNVEQRFCLDATRIVLDDLLRDAAWQPREFDDDDRAQLRSMLARPSPPWLLARLHALADALGVEHD